MACSAVKISIPSRSRKIWKESANASWTKETPRYAIELISSVSLSTYLLQDDEMGRDGAAVDAINNAIWA